MKRQNVGILLCKGGGFTKWVIWQKWYNAENTEHLKWGRKQSYIQRYYIKSTNID